MTNFRIIDEAQWTTSRNPGFLERVERALHTAAPMAQRYAAMRLPKQVTVRLMTPTALRRATLWHSHFVARDVAARYESREDQEAAYWTVRAVDQDFVKLHKNAWFMIGGRVLAGPDGDFLALMPAMHLAARTSDRALIQTLGHELVHIMQYLRLPGMDELFKGQIVEHRLGLREQHDVVPMPQAAEGHAMWVHRQIVAELGGVGDHFPGDPRPLPWLRRRARPYRALQSEARRDLYGAGQPFMTALFEAGGTDLLASMFDHADRLPATAELASPDLWLKRTQTAT